MRFINLVLKNIIKHNIQNFGIALISICPDRSGTNRQKTEAVAFIWENGNSKYNINRLLDYIQLKRSTYYDELKRMKKPDNYANLKATILKIFKESKETYGYRIIWLRLKRLGYNYCLDTICRLTGVLNIKVDIYSKHHSRYSSYKGKTGIVADNILKQKFNETIPYRVLHTDVTQVRLSNSQWGYISSITDEASREVICISVSAHPDMELIHNSFKKISNVVPNGTRCIIHSDQGWHYQSKNYQRMLKALNLTQSMSRKGNCHDNAPIESWFNLLKRECVNRETIHDINDLINIISEYVNWFNNIRI